MEQEISNTIIEHTHEINILQTRVNKLETVIDEINKLTVSIEKMSLIQTQMLEEQKQQRSDINRMKEQPAKDAKDIKNKIIVSIITTCLGVILGALLAVIIK